MDFVIWTTVVSVGLSVIFIGTVIRQVCYVIRRNRALKNPAQTVRRAVQQLDVDALKEASKRIAAHLEAGSYRRARILPDGGVKLLPAKSQDDDG